MTARVTVEIPLHRIAHARAGDKGNRLNVALFAYRAEYYDVLVQHVTETAVMQQFAHRRPSAVRRYLLPRIHALNYVLDDVLEGGVNSSLCIDRHGKSLSYLLLDMRIAVPTRIAESLINNERRPS